MILALALAATGLAGCIENPDWLNSTDAEVSALEHRGVADASASSWSEGAELIGILAVETREQMDPRLAADPEVGNGLAPAWWYVYCATQQEMPESEASSASGAAGGENATVESVSMVRAFKVMADGTVTSEDDAAEMAAGFEHDMAEALGEWSVDSTDALAAAKADESFRAAAEGMNATLIQGVARHEGTTAWWFAAASASGMVVASVDAVTGELIEVKPFDMGWQMPTFEMAARDPAEWVAEPIHIEGEDFAEPGAESVEYPFETMGPMYGPMAITFSPMFPTDGLHWAILDEDGERVVDGHLAGWGGSGDSEAEVVLEEAGAYTLAFEYMSSPPIGAPLPLGNGVDYAFTFDLVPGEPAEDEDEETQ